MAITTFKFAGFTLLALVLYHLLKGKWKKVLLLGASLVFYSTFAWQYALILSILAFLTYWTANNISRSSRKTPWVATGIFLNAGALLVFKAADFYLLNLQGSLERLGWKGPLLGLEILVPLGLSFYVTQGISYLVDVRKERIEPGVFFPDYWLFAVYFPKLLSGPMERAGQFFSHLNNPRAVDRQVFESSTAWILLGLLRKLFLADPLNSMMPGDVFTHPDRFAPHILATWLLAYGFALYNDFAGYTHIVRGISGLFGIPLSANFHVPYFSRDFSEFWSRWHISFSNWLRDYIFFPVSRVLRRYFKRTHPVNIIVPPLVTMTVSGLWHGLTPHMVVWGLLHGIYQVVERVPALWRPIIPPAKKPAWQQYLQSGMVFLLTMLAWVPFRADLRVTWSFWGQLAGLLNPLRWKGYLHPAGSVYLGSGQTINYQSWLLPDARVVILISAALLLDVWQVRQKSMEIIYNWSVWKKALVTAAILVVLTFAALANPQAPFIYQGF